MLHILLSDDNGQEVLATELEWAPPKPPSVIMFAGRFFRQSYWHKARGVIEYRETTGFMIPMKRPARVAGK